MNVKFCLVPDGRRERERKKLCIRTKPTFLFTIYVYTTNSHCWVSVKFDVVESTKTFEPARLQLQTQIKIHVIRYKFSTVMYTCAQ